MNKIFKVIFNKSLGRMVIVSEHAKGHGKAKSTQNKKNQSIASKTKVVKPLLVIISLCFSPYVFAENIKQSISCPLGMTPIKLMSEGGYEITLLNHNESAYIYWDVNNSIAMNSNCDQRSFLLSNAIGIGGSASDYGVALGYGALAYRPYNVAIGSQAKANGKNSVAIGANSVADRDNSFAVGNSTNLRQITSVAAGAQSTDAVNLGQIQGLLAGANIQTTVPAVMYSSLDSQNILLNGAGGTTISNLKAGTQATDAVNKKQMDDSVKIVDDKVTALDGVKTLAIQYDSTTKDTVSLKGVNGTKITNLQDATLDTNSTDAVTGRQLNTANQAINTLDYRLTTEVGTLDTRITSEVGALDGKITTNSNAITALDGYVTTEVGTLDTRITSEVGALDGKITTNSNAISALDGRVTTEVGSLDTRMTSEVSALDGKIMTNNNAISALDGYVTTEVGTLDTRITTEVGTLDGKITTNSNAISGLDGRVTVNETDIANLQQGQGTLNQLAVQYDSTTQDKISLNGVNGTKITNLQAGDISSASSTDAVTGGQLFTTNQNVSNLDARVTTEVGTLNTRIGTEVTGLETKIQSNSTAILGLDGRVTTNETDIANLQSGQSSLNQLAVQYDSASQDVVTLQGIHGTKLTNLQAGDISSVSSTDAVTGGQLFSTNTALTFLSGQFDSAMQQATSVLGGGSSYNNGVFVLPTYSIQGKNYSNVGDTFGAVNNEISALKTSVTDLRNYVDQQDQGVLGSANGYTDAQSSNALSNAKQYVDQQDAQTLADANAYSDQQANQTLTAANGYTDQKAAATLANANAYADDRVAAAGQYISINGSGGSAGGGSSSSGLNSTGIGPNTVVTGDHSTAVGVGNQVSGHNAGAFGDPNIVTANGSYVVGNDNTVSGDNTFVLGNNVNATAKNSVALGNNSTLTRDNTISVGSTDNERQITYVADATEATDAVNLRQMQSANSDTLSASKTYTDTQIGNLENSFNDFSYQTDRRFKEVDKQFDRQGAMSAAMMNMATSTSGLKGRNRVGVGAGFQGSEKAVAVGYQRMINENTSLSLGGAFTDDESSGGAGVGFSW